MSCKEYRQPRSMEELREALEVMTEHSRILAGGTDLIIELKEKGEEPDLMVSLCALKELKGIREEDGDLVIGAMSTHTELADHELIRRHATALSMACAHVGSEQIRNKGTIGGSLANASVAGDMLPVLCLLHGVIEIYDRNGVTRRVRAEEFQVAPGRSILEAGQIITGVRIPIVIGRRSVFKKLGSRQEVTIAEISVSICWMEGQGIREDLELVLGAVDKTPIFIPQARELLQSTCPGKEALDQLSDILAERIRTIRLNRKRPPKRKITEEERLYKERAVRGVLYDAVDAMAMY